jgi:hypothetical protein
MPIKYQTRSSPFSERITILMSGVTFEDLRVSRGMMKRPVAPTLTTDANRQVSTDFNY